HRNVRQRHSRQSPALTKARLLSFFTPRAALAGPRASFTSTGQSRLLLIPTLELCCGSAKRIGSIRHLACSLPMVLATACPSRSQRDPPRYSTPSASLPIMLPPCSGNRRQQCSSAFRLYSERC